MSSVKLGSPLKSEKLIFKIKRYINHKIYKFKLWLANIIHEFMLVQKLIQIAKWIFNVIITGALIYYVLNNNTLFAYGLASVFVPYYLNIIVQIIKKPYQDK